MHDLSLSFSLLLSLSLSFSLFLSLSLSFSLFISLSLSFSLFHSLSLFLSLPLFLSLSLSLHVLLLTFLSLSLYLLIKCPGQGKCITPLPPCQHFIHNNNNIIVYYYSSISHIIKKKQVFSILHKHHVSYEGIRKSNLVLRLETSKLIGSIYHTLSTLYLRKVYSFFLSMSYKKVNHMYFQENLLKIFLFSVDILGIGAKMLKLAFNYTDKKQNKKFICHSWSKKRLFKSLLLLNLATIKYDGNTKCPIQFPDDDWDY